MTYIPIFLKLYNTRLKYWVFNLFTTYEIMSSEYFWHHWRYPMKSWAFTVYIKYSYICIYALQLNLHIHIFLGFVKEKKLSPLWTVCENDIKRFSVALHFGKSLNRKLHALVILLMGVDFVNYKSRHKWGLNAFNFVFPSHYWKEKCLL